MDFGFGAFLQKFEEFYGRTANKILVGCLGLTAFGLSASMLVTNVFAPIHGWITGNSDAFDQAWSFMLSLATAIYVAVVAASILNRNWKG